MKYFGIFQLIAIPFLISACTSLDPVQTAEVTPLQTQARNPAEFSLQQELFGGIHQDPMSLSDFSQSNVYCENADKLIGQQANILKLRASLSFVNDRVPRSLNLQLDMKNHEAIAAAVSCSSGGLQTTKDGYFVSCGKDKGALWAFSLNQAMSKYAVKNSVIFFQGDVAIPSADVLPGVSGTAHLRVNCYASARNEPTAADINELKNLRFMFGHIEREQ